MSNVCEITGKKRLKGNRVSHANNKTRHFQQPNVRVQKIFVPELNSSIKVKISSAALRTIDKHGGLSRYLVTANPATLSLQMQKLRKTIIQKGLH